MTAAEVKSILQRGMERIEIEYYGEGDSGEINEITCFPVKGFVLTSGEYDKLGDYAYELLGDYHSGWEINYGSSGTITVRLQDGKLHWKIDHNEYSKVADNSVMFGEGDE